ncbi:ACT domain-containing protein [Corynebacterium caspium]|uniref:ACT domain-containing protein n=1 Tax=Corynebacterium caspium TaxID=234828 RepID=UPI00037D041C|nr:ACT domain-containing protein [Corynebacterium caspium]WKD59273.1 hypothetical protein CCASP_04380 [Corynebacterium caspium DSM 44850]
MYAIMTVTGEDHTGIIAGVTAALAENNINIVDVSQTLMGRWFTMILRVEIPEDLTVDAVQKAMAPVEAEQQLVIRIQSEVLFSAVNEI